MIKCPLCGSKTSFYLSFRHKDYRSCNNCHSVFLDEEYTISEEKEMKRYELHNTNINDFGYLKFIKPLSNYVENNFTNSDKGLDFGCGKEGVAAEYLSSKGLSLAMYDPYFHDNKHLLNETYDFIISIEVIEHFNNPDKEFALLYKMLKNGGQLILMTDLLSEDTDFLNWYYKNDETHVFFYSPKTFIYIKEKYGFDSIAIRERLIVLTK